MLIDPADFPFVWMRMNAQPIDRTTYAFAEFDALLARRRPFVFLNDEGLGDSRPERSPDELKEASLWMKQHRSDLQAFVKAAIFIEPDAEKRRANEPFTSVYERFWGYPMRVVASTDDAIGVARQLLNEASGHSG
ncbi:hypothetical protein [Paraburkholderia caballeronis]|uniref:hypothetical protein n=1 Tax=Paraburkholderia caballeronis TaxID=416943 RepID=UPI0010654FF8|nr:hypothetical protein [Paraburkholderia caballeronis]TDV09459.1 hypothetical protein C7408_11539 [Paraburkholderia caballeronis]TDV13730.1 hypothetical protein C7406_11639 [Paraburkholderia caballeronis]TDV22912.1 hypothetical protein C7404_11539 [Paraburkholderia caballeronis]